MDLCRAERRRLEASEPAARADFDVYLQDGALRYLKAPCDPNDLPADRREVGHESLNFTFAPPAGAVFNGKCMATRQLPNYGIAKIETGQWIPGGERLWDAEIVVGR